MTALDDRRHATTSMETEYLVINMTSAISTPDLYKKFCQKTEKVGLTVEEMTSLSLFKLQIWLKR